MKKNPKSNQWAARQNRDPYVNRAQRAGFRARSVFKLEEIDRKYRLIKPASLIVDLGSAPGSWSQYAAAGVRAENQVIAVDLLAMKAIDKVNFIRGDFTNEAVVRQIFAALDGRPVDLVLSDLSPNLSGIRSTDQARAETLQYAVIEFCRRALKPGGKLLTKLFAGESAPSIRAHLDGCFDCLRSVKPAASRSESRETYLLAVGYKGRAEPGTREPNGVYLAHGAT